MTPSDQIAAVFDRLEQECPGRAIHATALVDGVALRAWTNDFGDAHISATVGDRRVGFDVTIGTPRPYLAGTTLDELPWLADLATRAEWTHTAGKG